MEKKIVNDEVDTGGTAARCRVSRFLNLYQFKEMIRVVETAKHT
jgi:hypothetical protein